jgi:transposase
MEGKMPKVIEVEIKHTIKELYQKGWSKRRLAKELGVHRDTVTKYLEEDIPDLKEDSICTTAVNTGADEKCTTAVNTGADDIDIHIETANCGRKSSCEGFFDIIQEKYLLGLTGQRIWQDLKADYGFTGNAQAVRRYIRKLKKVKRLPDRVMHSEPGEELQVDFGRGAPVVMGNGRKKRPHLFRAVLSHSRKGYSEVVWSQSTETFIRVLENAFRHFGGVPKKVVPDNLKAAVIKADWYDPEINPKLRTFARHYGTVILPTKAYTPEHKGKVENGVKYCQDNALKGRIFNNLAEHNQFLQYWEKNIADTRIHGTTQIQVGKAFAESEKEALGSLPTSLFPSFEEGERKVQRNGHIELHRSFYSVPPEYLGQTVWVRYTERTVTIYDSRFSKLTSHCRVEKGKYSTHKHHIHPAKINQREYGSDYLLQQLLKIGPECAVWGEVMLENRGIEGITVLQGLLSLKKKYSACQLNDAAINAVNAGIFYLKPFKELLTTEDETPSLDFLECHPFIRKLGSYAELTPDVFEPQNKKEA